MLTETKRNEEKKITFSCAACSSKNSDDNRQLAKTTNVFNKKKKQPADNVEHLSHSPVYIRYSIHSISDKQAQLRSTSKFAK